VGNLVPVRTLRTVLAATTVALLGAAPTAASTASSIVYHCGRTADAANDANGRTDICRINADARSPRFLTKNGGVGGAKYALPSVALNGSALAFTYGFPDRQPFTANADASGRQRVSEADVLGVAISPYGARVAWIADRLYVAARDGSARVAGPSGLTQPAWMGQRLLAVKNRRQVCLLRADLAGCERIVAGGKGIEVTSPAASPDHRFVAAHVEGGPVGLGLFATATGRLVKMLHSFHGPDDTGDDHPTWSPDGQAVAFDDFGSIWVRSMTKHGGAQLLTTASDYPSWGGVAGHRSPRLRITRARVRGKRLSVSGRIRSSAPGPLWASFDGHEWPNRIYATFHPRVRQGRFHFHYRIHARYAYFCDVVVSTPGDGTYLRAAAHKRPRGGVCVRGGD
jgi:hypothetical protein